MPDGYSNLPRLQNLTDDIGNGSEGAARVSIVLASVRGFQFFRLP